MKLTNNSIVVPRIPGVYTHTMVRGGASRKPRVWRHRVVMPVDIGEELAEMDVYECAKWAHSQGYISGYSIQSPNNSYVLLSHPDVDGEQCTFQLRQFVDWISDRIAEAFFQECPASFYFLTDQINEDE